MITEVANRVALETTYQSAWQSVPQRRRRVLEPSGS